MFNLIRNWRRKRWASQGLPSKWEAVLQQNYHLYPHIPAEWRERLRARILYFVHEKYWEGISAYEITDEMRFTIAAMACTLTLNFNDDEAIFPKVLTVLVHSDQYERQASHRDPSGVVTEGNEWRLGEAWNLGPVALSWPDVQAGGECLDGVNLVYHEFSHVLDMTNGEADGVPPRPSDSAWKSWRTAIEAEYAAVRRQFQSGQGIAMDPYALTNLAEFFAVSTENYIERPHHLRHHRPQLYGMLEEFYQLRTVDWVPEQHRPPYKRLMMS